MEVRGHQTIVSKDLKPSDPDQDLSSLRFLEMEAQQIFEGNPDVDRIVVHYSKPKKVGRQEWEQIHFTR